LLTLYYSLTQGKMSIAAPVSALFAAVLPVVVGSIIEGLPQLIQVIGFGIALTSVWLISSGHQAEPFQLKHITDLRLPILAGVGFGSYFIFIHYATHGTDALLWPMFSSRMAGTLMLFAVVLFRRESFVVPQSAWVVVLLNATLDLGGNFFYILASRTGRLDIAAILSSLYPASTVLLAWILLKEKIAPLQVLGIVLAFGAIILMTL
jgi:drug/metabolite transporter (DMT)-like permease